MGVTRPTGVAATAILRWIMVVTVAVAMGLSVLVASPAAAADPPVNTSPPQVKGRAVYTQKLVAGAGHWENMDDLTFRYQWLRNGTKIGGATERAYRIDLLDLGHRLAVQVAATDADGEKTFVVSEATNKVKRAFLRNRRAPQMVGVQRFGRVLSVDPGRWRTTPTRLRYQWLRGGRKLPGATRARYRIQPEDVDRRLRVRVSATAPGYTVHRKKSWVGPVVRHRVDARRTVTYSVETRGTLTTSLRTFRSQAQESFTDPRGWRGSGIVFRRVARGGSFSLVLSEASRVPGFSSACSSFWSCRVGRYVVINQERWKHASPAWNAADGALRDYRHMVVNHEVGHWLGLGHSGCPGRGRAAPVMMQQSKGLDGCRFNPWPTLGEQASRTPHARGTAIPGRVADAEVHTVRD